jgi:hypothetical protein
LIIIIPFYLFYLKIKLFKYRGLARERFNSSNGQSGLSKGSHHLLFVIFIIINIILKQRCKMETKVFTAIIHKEEDISAAECPEIGIVSQGFTIEKALTV